MTKKVQTRYMGIPHYYAFCDGCEWTYSDYKDRRKGEREIRKHVATTGHRVQLEKAVVTFYEPEELEPRQ